MQLTNPWVGYFDRTYEQIKANVLTKFQSLVPEITDHNETNPWVKGISIWSAMVEMLGYYIDNSAREVFITQAQEFASAVKIAKLFDYRVKGPTPGSTTLRFTSDIPATGPITIPQYTECQTTDGIKFVTTEVGTIDTGETYVDIPALQMEQVTGVSLGNSDGSADQEFVLETKVADNTVSILVDVTPYTGQDTFAFSFSTSTHFVAGLDEDQKMKVTFGDDINGKIPPSGNAITANYFITEGTDGNVGANKITTINDAITVPGGESISVNNATSASGGADAEDLTKLRKRIPLSVRTKYRAVTKQDFIDLVETVQGVERVGVQFDCSINNIVYIFIAPEGGGSASTVLIDTVTDFMNLRKIITTKIEVQTAGEIIFQIQANVQALPGFANLTVKSSVETALLNYFDPANQEIEGEVNVGDVYEVIEGVTGVDSSELSLLLAVPTARPLNNENTLDWDRAMQPASSTTVKWLIRFVSVSTFELHKDDVFVNTFNVDVEVTQTEIVFTVNGNHTFGDDFEFYTYPYNASVDLVEPSIPATNIGSLTINVSGGV